MRRSGRTLVWLLAGASGGLLGVAAPSCSSNGGRVIPGYGNDCASDADCAQYNLICAADLTCVECIVNTDCVRDMVCERGTCHLGSGSGTGGTTGGGCNPACPAGTVCDTSNATCVQC